MKPLRVWSQRLSIFATVQQNGTYTLQHSAVASSSRLVLQISTQLMLNSQSHHIQVGCLNTDETEGQLTNSNCMFAYAAVLKRIFSCRHDLSIEGALGGYVIRYYHFLSVYLKLEK